MKKVLLATTALTLSAGVAAAEVSLSGSAEMGVVGGNNDAETLFFQSVDVRFGMSGETDNGISFGATVDLEDALDEAVGGSDIVDTAGNNPDFTVFLKGAFGNLTMGDTDGAFDWALTEVGMVGSIDDSETAHSGYNGNAGLDGIYNGQVLRYDYSFGAIGLGFSAELDETGVEDSQFGLGAKWSGDMGGATLSLGAGYQTADAASIFGVSGKVSTGPLDFVVNYSDLDGYGGNDSHAAIGVGYTMDAISLHANYGVHELTAGGENTGIGLAASYDLGGGAAVHAAMGTSDDADGGDDSTWSLGVAMSF